MFRWWSRLIQCHYFFWDDCLCYVGYFRCRSCGAVARVALFGSLCSYIIAKYSKAQRVRNVRWTRTSKRAGVHVVHACDLQHANFRSSKNHFKMNRKLETICITQNTKSKHLRKLVAELQVAGRLHSPTDNIKINIFLTKSKCYSVTLLEFGCCLLRQHHSDQIFNVKIYIGTRPMAYTNSNILWK